MRFVDMTFALLDDQATDMHVGRPRTSKDTHRRARRAEGRPAGAIHGEVSRVRRLDVRIKSAVERIVKPSEPGEPLPAELDQRAR